MISETETVEQRLYLNAIAADAPRFAHAVRGQKWKIGFTGDLMWCLVRICQSHLQKATPAIMTAIRHLCLAFV